MAPSAGGTKFASVNLNKHYGQPASIGTGAAGSGSQGSGRSRLHAQGGMLLLTRPVKSQPSGTKGVKLTVPRPVNLPSLRKEHSGNGPNTPLVVASAGVSGWSKQQQQQPAHNACGQSGSAISSANGNLALTLGRSAALSTESTGGTLPSSTQNGDLRLSVVGARTVQLDGDTTLSQPLPSLVRKAVVLRGEDFPTLQASLPPLAAPPQQRQRDLQQKLREKRHELKEQHVKVHGLSQQLTENFGTLQQLGPQLQPVQSMRPQTNLNQTSSSISYDKGSVSQQDISLVLSNGNYERANTFLPVPPPLIRLNHTSNWTDDERETLQSLRSQSDSVVRDQLRNESRSLDLRAQDRSDKFSYGLPSASRNGLHSGYARNGEANKDPDIGKDTGFTSDGWNRICTVSSTYASKESSSNRLGVNSKEGRASNLGWEGSYKRGWASAKDSISEIDAAFGRSTGFTRDGYTKDTYKRVGTAGPGSGRETLYRRESPARDAHRDKEGNVRDGYFQGGGFACDNVRRRIGDGQDKYYPFQGDRSGKNFGYQSEFLSSHGRTSSSVQSKLQDTIGYDFGRNKRHSYTESSFREGIAELPFLDLRKNSGPGMEHAYLGLKVLRRKKDVKKEATFWDPERESFEAELERVQEMLEQERQRDVEERERAAELARKELEEREQAAREEEERQRKLEQEAREAALKEEREITEAAQKLEEEKRVWDEEKRRIALEEERRREAARQKLKELEERIAKRENEKKREEECALRKDERVYMERFRDKDKPMLYGEMRKRDDGYWEEQGHFTSISRGLDDDDDDERGPFKLSRSSYSSAREILNEQTLQVKHLERGARSLNSKTGIMLERPKAIPPWRRELVDNGNDLLLHDSSLSNWQHEHLSRSSSSRDASHGSQRHMPPALSEDRGTSDLLMRKDRSSHLQDQLWASRNDLEVPASYSLSNMDSGYYDSPYDRDVDHNWIRDTQRLSSPSRASYLHAAHVADPLQFGRSRHCLPKQPRVLPPPSRISMQKPILKTGKDNNLSFTSTVCDGSFKIEQSESEFEGGEVRMENVKHESEGADDGEHMENAQYEDKPKETVLQLQSAIQPNIPSQSSDADSQETLSLRSHNPSEMQAQSAVSVLSMKANIEDVTSCSEAPDEEICGSEIDQDSPAVSKDASGDDEDVEKDLTLEENPREADAEETSDRGYDVAAVLNLENQELDSSKKDEDTASRLLDKDYDEVLLDEQYYQRRCEEEADKLQEGVKETQVVVAVEETVDSDVHSKESINVSLNLQETVQDVAEPLLPGGYFLSSTGIDSVQLRELDVSSSRQSFMQQFQQPFSFMAMPFPQSDTCSTDSQQPLGLAPFHGLQNQLDMPFQLQLGLFPGNSLLPNAIQIGSIQMPLHLHSRSTQLNHLHSSQAPIFQFGQIGHPAPLPQPLHMLQPAMQIHHPLTQITATTPPQSSQAHTVQQVEDSCQGTPIITMQQDVQCTYPGEVPVFPNLNLGLLENKRMLEGSIPVNVVSRNASKPDMQSEHDSTVCVNQQVGHDHGKLSESESKDVNKILIQEASADRIIGSSISTFLIEDQVKSNERSMPKSVGMPHGGRKRGSGIRSGHFGRGYGKFYNGKTFEGPMFTSESGMWSEDGGGYGHMRPGRRNIHRAEFGVKDSGSSVDSNAAHSIGLGTWQPVHERSRCISSEAFSAFSKNKGIDGQTRHVTQIQKSRFTDGGQNAGNVSCPSQGVRRGDWLGTANTAEKNVITGVSSGSHSLEENVKKYVNLEAHKDIPLQSGVVCVFEQPGIEVPKDEDDFIEVRSKRQMLNDRREQREKENKTKSKDFKPKELAVHKQMLPVRISQQSSQNVERRSSFSKFSADAVGNEIKPALQGYASGLSSTSSQSGVNAPSQLLAPIGTPSNCLSNMAIDRKATSLRAMQANSSMVVTLNDSNTDRPVSSVIQDSSSNTPRAWGSQQSSQQVVSFVQIQLQGDVKPVCSGSSLSEHLPFSERDSMLLEPGIPVSVSQQLPSPERGSVVLEPGIPVSVAHEKASPAVSGPISSLLAGEKIQFGAVTSPTLVSPRSHPLSPSCLTSRTDGVSDLKSQAMHLAGLDTLDGDVGCTPGNKWTKRHDESRHVTDAEAEAEAAASAVAAAAFSSDESVGSTHHSNERNVPFIATMMPISGNSFENAGSTAGSLGTRPIVMQTPMTEDSGVALPPDLSIETPPLAFHGAVPHGSPGLVLQPLPGGPSPFPCLEMGTILGGPIFALAPREDASSLPQGSNMPVSSIEGGHPAIGPGGVGGWQQRHVGGVMDSFYGPPSGLTGSFISPTAGIPNMQGPPHMLVYTNPFASVGQYGQVGVNFMGPAYIPSGKQPDWRHTPVTTSSLVGLGSNEGERVSNLGGILATQHSTGMPNIIQHLAPGGPSIVPAAPPLSLFDINIPSPFQISNADVPLQSHWSNLNSQHPLNVPVSGPLVGLTLQPHHLGSLPNQAGNLPRMMETSGLHPVSVLKLAHSAPFQSVDAVHQFPNELGLADSVSPKTSPLTGAGQIPASGGHISISTAPITAGTSGNKMPRGYHSSHTICASNVSGDFTTSSSGTAVLETALGSLDGQSTNGSSCFSHFQAQNFRQSAAGGLHTHPVGYADKKNPQQGVGRANVGIEWSGGHRRGGASGQMLLSERGSLGGRGFPASSKLKQVYVAKSSSSQKTGVHDSLTPEEVSRATIGC